jgi:uncharacterized protein (TIGR02452 family)
MSQSRDELCQVFQDTRRLAKATTNHSFKQSVKWNIFDDIPPDTELGPGHGLGHEHGPGEVHVVNEDTLTVAMELADKGLDPLVLNMASDFHPGGGVAKGSRAQEEQLFRCTNYCLCVNKGLYPIADDEVIVTDGVTVIKDKDFNQLDTYYTFDFIAVAAVRRPPLNYGDTETYLDPVDHQKMINWIEAIFRYAIYQEKDSLVLGALGCGAFRNPRVLVKDMFKDALNKYRNYFKNITFAVLSNEQDPNYEVFKELEGVHGP